MQTSIRGINIIKKFEGFSLKAYLCSSNNWTIGYGHTGPDIKENSIISIEEANAFLLEDIKDFELNIKDCIKSTIQLNQNQFDALVSLSFNIGKTAFKNSTLIKQLNKGEINKAANHFLDWVKIDGKTSKGLTKRRLEERTLFLS